MLNVGQNVLVKREALTTLLFEVEEDQMGKIIAIAEDKVLKERVVLIKMVNKKYGLHSGKHPFVTILIGDFSEEDDCLWCPITEDYITLLS